jgi:hypothetical protein
MSLRENEELGMPPPTRYSMLDAGCSIPSPSGTATPTSIEHRGSRIEHRIEAGSR